MEHARLDGAHRRAGQRIVGQKHSRLKLARGGESWEAILFDHTDTLPRDIHAVYRPEINAWQGRESLELVVEHWRPAG